MGNPIHTAGNALARVHEPVETSPFAPAPDFEAFSSIETKVGD